MDNNADPVLPAGRSENELRALLDAAVDGVIVIDHEGRIATFNRAAERLFGYRAAEIIGQPVTALMPEPYRSAHDGYMHKYLQTGQAHIIGVGREIVAQRRDGTVFPASLAVGEVPGSQPPRFVGFLHDISSRKLAVEALRRERDRAQSYLDLAQVILVALDQAGRIELINRKGCEILGYTETELIGRDWFEQCVPEGRREEARARLRAFLGSTATQPDYVEATVVTRGSEIKLVAWREILIRDEVGAPIGVLSSGEDVTERRRSEQALTRSESMLRAAQAIAKLGNYEVYVPAGPSFWSEQMYGILGSDPADGPIPVDEFVARIVHPDDRERVQRELARAFNETGRLDLEFRIVRPDGSSREVHSLAQIQPSADGESLVISGTLHDITERKLAEEELRQGQERLTHVGRLSTMGEMATGLAHEINQPLTAIATYAQAAVRMIDAAPGADPSELREPLVQITTQALRAGEVIRRLRAFVKNRATRTETVDMNRLIEDLRVLAEPDARVNDVRLVVALAPAVPAVSADPVQIQQVLLNLIRNAIDATLEAPAAPREIQVTSAQSADGVEVAVVDRAGGIAPEIAANLFNPFYTTKAAGTGLGLAISRSIIRAHRGKLGHRPTPEGGTTFYFTLPPLPGG